MALKETIKQMRDLLNNITHDLQKAENGNKAASQRVRTGTVRLEKVAKLYRKESIKAEKNVKPTKKPAKKAAAKPAPAAKKAAAGKPKTAKVKAKSKSHQKALARPRALSLKKPTAKLPTRRLGL